MSNRVLESLLKERGGQKKVPKSVQSKVAPTGNQVSVFSTDKIDSCLRGSDIIQDYYIDTKTKDQVSYKEFTNGSKIYLRSAFHSADAIRGISNDRCCIDEIQDMTALYYELIHKFLFDIKRPVIIGLMGDNLFSYF